MTLPEHSGGNGPIGTGDLAAALDWWRDAGVEYEFSNAPRPWLAEPDEESAAAQPTTRLVASALTPPTAAPAPPIGGNPEQWPQQLDQFAPWWTTEPSLDNGMITGRVPPRGPQRALLMVLVDYPEASDSDRLLSGPLGKQLDAICLALGLSSDDIYLASALPRHMPMPDWAALGTAGLKQLVAHHIALAAPQRLLIFDSRVSSLLGHDPAKNAHYSAANQQGTFIIPSLVAPALTALGPRPRGKSRLWTALLDWIDT